MKITLEQVRDYYQRKYLDLNDYFGFEQHPEKIAAVKFILEIIEKFIPKKPRSEGLPDWYCPTCKAWIKFDSLNMPTGAAPKRCDECGQVFDWEGGE